MRWLEGTLTSSALLLLLAGAAGADLFRVGAGGSAAGCTHSTIQSAIDQAKLTAGSDSIWISNNQSYVNEEILISLFSGASLQLNVVGGFDSCMDPTSDPGSPTTVDGTPAGPVFRIQGSSYVYLANLVVTGSGEYGVKVDGMSTALLESLSLLNNAGGLVVATGSSAHVFGSQIYSNVSLWGGGVRCSGSTLTLQDVAVYGNEANHGGGLYLVSGCHGTFLGTVTISNNLAFFKGGGLFVDDSTVGDLGRGRGAAPATGTTWISGNDSDDDGGGIYLTGFSSYDVDNSHIIDNTADDLGGGAYLEGGSILSLSRGVGTCTSKPCVEISANRLASQVRGSAVYATGSSEVYLFGGALSENSNSTNSAYSLYLDGSSAWLEGVEMFGNRGPAVFLVANTSTLTLAFASAARNLTSSGADALMVTVAGSTAEVYSSAFRDTSGFSVVISGTISGDCLMSNTLAGASTTYSVVRDPQFLDPLAGDLRLRPASPAVDYCDAGAYTPVMAAATWTARCVATTTGTTPTPRPACRAERTTWGPTSCGGSSPTASRAATRPPGRRRFRRRPPVLRSEEVDGGLSVPSSAA